jgi:cysteinyl-tRNA synthetase
MREVAVKDTMSGERRPIPPEAPVGIYACGPTVYSRIHIGNARPFVVFSLFSRFLKSEGYEVKLVVNVTDVNDKIYTAAADAGIPSAELAAGMTEAYFEDTDRLGLGRPDAEPLATATIGPIIDLIADLVESGHAYESGGDVYFAVRSFDDYGKLSHRPTEEMEQGEDDSGSLKRDPLDFALWKAHKEGEDTFWESPWGPGRPGWHIECSAMAEQEVGSLPLTIHGGGSDLVFPHHENEIAQSEAARGLPFASIWMHNGMISTGSAAKPSSPTSSRVTTASHSPSARRSSRRPPPAISGSGTSCVPLRKWASPNWTSPRPRRSSGSARRLPTTSTHRKPSPSSSI